MSFNPRPPIPKPPPWIEQGKRYTITHRNLGSFEAECLRVSGDLAELYLRSDTPQLIECERVKGDCIVVQRQYTIAEVIAP